MGFCNKITPTCEVCFEVLYGKCNDVLTLSLGLTSSTTFFLNLIDKFDIVTPLTITTDISGDFTLTQTWTEFFGDVEVEIFSDSGRTELVDFVQNTFAYNCVILTQELSGSNNVAPPDVFENLFSFKFDGVDEDFNAGTDASLDFTGNLFISSWVKPTDFSTIRTIFFRSTIAPFKGYVLEIFTDGKIRTLVDGGNATKSTNVVSTGGWSHILATKPLGGNMQLYLNGIEVVYDSQTTSDPTTNGAVAMIGGTADLAGWVGRWWLGGIDEVVVGNDFKTAADTLAIYNSGKPRDERNIFNGVSYWRMGDKAIWDGADFTLIDQIGSNDATSVNMEFIDKVLDTP